jgi:hypothetical protein
VLARVQVHLRVREVRDAARVIDIEVGDDDVPHVARREPERLDLRQRGLREVEPRARELLERLRHRHGAGAVARAEAGVDQHEPVARRLDDQAVRDHVARE